MDEDDDLDESESAENNDSLSLESITPLPPAYRRRLPDERMLRTTDKSRQDTPRNWNGRRLNLGLSHDYFLT